jgi:hypothetical protein
MKCQLVPVAEEESTPAAAGIGAKRLEEKREQRD